MPLSETQWKVIDIIVKGVGAAAITGCITIVGYWIQDEQRQSAQRQELLQALVNFNSAQKTLDVNVGMQLFSKFVDHYLQSVSSGSEGDRQTLLMLRLLALNFQDVPINLKPLFEDLDRRLQNEASGVSDAKVTSNLRKQLRDVAKEVANRQAFRVTLQGGILSDPEAIKVGQTISFQSQGIPLSIEATHIKDDYVSVVVTEEGGANERRFNIRVSYFDMPIIDNIKLNNSNRVAILLSDTGADTATLRIASFAADLAADRFDIKEMTRDLYSKRY